MLRQDQDGGGSADDPLISRRRFALHAAHRFGFACAKVFRRAARGVSTPVRRIGFEAILEAQPTRHRPQISFAERDKPMQRAAIGDRDVRPFEVAA
jgi:hypothetical protein